MPLLWFLSFDLLSSNHVHLYLNIARIASTTSETNLLYLNNI